MPLDWFQHNLSLQIVFFKKRNTSFSENYGIPIGQSGSILQIRYNSVDALIVMVNQFSAKYLFYDDNSPVQFGSKTKLLKYLKQTLGKDERKKKL